MGEQDRTIWCGNLPRELKDEHLFELFLQAGPLERVFRPKDRDSGQPREYAFITYADEESVPYALDLYQDTQLYGRTLRMQPRGIVKQPRGAVKPPPQHSRSATQPLMPPQRQGQPQPWQQQFQQPQQQQSNETMMRQMAVRQMMMMASQQQAQQQAQQVAMAQCFQQPQQPQAFQQQPSPWQQPQQQQQQQPSPWQQQQAPPSLMLGQFNFGPFGGGGGGAPGHQRSHTHHW